jgi:lysophospholipase
MQRMGMEIPEFCNACWDRHCWNGTYNSTLPNDFFEPTLVLNSTETYEEFITSPEAAGLTPTNASSSNDSKDATASESADASSASGSATKSGAIQLGVNFGLTIAMIIAVAALS